MPELEREVWSVEENDTVIRLCDAWEEAVPAKKIDVACCPGARACFEFGCTMNWLNRTYEVSRNVACSVPVFDVMSGGECWSSRWELTKRRHSPQQVGT